jgi:drug/metabolite transporter (DMT)-like permease
MSMLLYLEPAVSVLGAAAFLGERVTIGAIAGGLLILAGLAATGMARPAATGLPSPRTGGMTRAAEHGARQHRRCQHADDGH